MIKLIIQHKIFSKIKRIYFYSILKRKKDHVLITQIQICLNILLLLTTTIKILLIIKTILMSTTINIIIFLQVLTTIYLLNSISLTQKLKLVEELKLFIGITKLQLSPNILFITAKLFDLIDFINKHSKLIIKYSKQLTKYKQF